MKSTILITGAAGRIGRTLTEALDGEYLLRLYDKDPPAHRPHAVSIQGDLRNRKALLGAMQGADAVIHLAGIPEERPLEELIEANMLGTYSVFEAARLAHVPRVIFASSIQAVGFHRMETGVSQASRIRPSGYYGVTKAFGEALGSLYADKFGLSVACLRIASFEPEPVDERQLSTWLSPKDCVALFRSCLTAPPFSFLIVYGVSANQAGIVRDTPPGPLLYRPTEDAHLFRDQIQRSDVASTLFVGGEFCGRDFVGEFARVS